MKPVIVNLNLYQKGKDCGVEPTHVRRSYDVLITNEYQGNTDIDARVGECKHVPVVNDSNIRQFTASLAVKLQGDFQIGIPEPVLL